MEENLGKEVFNVSDIGMLMKIPVSGKVVPYRHRLSH